MTERSERTKLTRVQKRALAMRLLKAAGGIVDRWDTMAKGEDLQGLTKEDVSQQLAKWLQYIPNTKEFWDERLAKLEDLEK